MSTANDVCISIETVDVGERRRQRRRRCRRQRRRGLVPRVFQGSIEFQGSFLVPNHVQQSSQSLVASDLEDGKHGEGEDKALACRICQLTFDEDSESDDTMIELGCKCKGELGTVHKQCAETWFRTKGDMICEICCEIPMNYILKLEKEVGEYNHVAEGENEAQADYIVYIAEMALQADHLREDQNTSSCRRLGLASLIALVIIAMGIAFYFHSKYDH